MKNIKVIISGFLMGLANIIPGISGGTILVLLGIYEETIHAFTGLVDPVKRRKSVEFLGVLLIGLGLGLVIGAFSVKYFLELNYTQTMVFFGGLIIFSTPKYIKDELKSKTKFKPLPFLISFTALLLLVIFTLNISKGAKIETVPALDPALLGFIFISGIIAGAAMIFPGVSGSMLMLIIGSYVYFTSFISFILTSLSFDLLVYLGSLGLGILIGIIVSIKISELLLKNYPDVTFSIITGLITASTIGMFIKAFYAVEIALSTVIISIAVLASSLVIITLVELLAKKGKRA